MFFTPKHVKEGRHYRHALKRLIHFDPLELSLEIVDAGPPRV